jgi:arsenate reductase
MLRVPALGRQAFAEFLGSAGLVTVVIGAYITAAYWWSSSTSFANPMIDVARTLTNTFAGVAPASVPMFAVMQSIGAAAAIAAVSVLYPGAAESAEDVVLPHPQSDSV